MNSSWLKSEFIYCDCLKLWKNTEIRNAQTTKKILTFFNFYKTISAIKNDFSGQLHRFLASLTDTAWKMESTTVLYIPKEGADLVPEVASKNKELVQRLESRYLWIYIFLVWVMLKF